MRFFDLQHTLLAKHAQHIVLVHFPIALVMVALLFDLLALRWRDRAWDRVAYCNLSIAALSVFPVIITGLLAWRWQLEAAPIRGALRLHLILGITSAVLVLVTWAIARRAPRLRLPFEFVTVTVVAATAHLGGVVAGVVT
ncbi:MAG TPA: DUF2231 domain-containing protein [Candidatus Koribacter sp.]|jgi:uncharacterized membrane protein